MGNIKLLFNNNIHYSGKYIRRFDSLSDVATNLLQEHKFPNADEKKRKINLVKADIGKCCKGNKRHLNDGCLYCYKDENLWNRI